MSRKASILQEKSEHYSFRIMRLYRFLLESQHEGIVSKQILRSGTSIGANIAEAQNAQSNADFINKLSIALKETNETAYWLKILFNGKYINELGYNSMLNDNEEIAKMLVSSIKTLKQKMGIDDTTR
ncbi:MAG: four helix bundle protein [Prevotella sp.]|nr:four helix bundle protein [Prevotella sp.]